MANEITIPALPCRSIDEVEAFYTMLGFKRTYYQTLPNPYVAMQLEDINLHFFGMPELKPEDSYSTCMVIVEDTGVIYRSFAAAMRSAHGKLLVEGIPRMTRPRRRKNVDNVSGFTVIDPGGNWIRFFNAKREPEAASREPSKLAKLLDNVVVQADSHGVHERASVVLDDVIRREGADAPAVDLVEALAYRAELAIRSGDQAAAAEAIARARVIELTDAEREGLSETMESLDDLEALTRA